MIYKEHIKCRVCDSNKLIPYLDLGLLPLSNNLASSTTDSIHFEKYPLKVLFCEGCGLSQLSIVVPAEKMFSHYVYRSGISQGYVNHCVDMAIELKEKHNLNENSFHIDIAGNDGTLLLEFKKIIGHNVLNVDPAINLAAICEAAGIVTKVDFWGIRTAKNIVHAFGKADLITATNVFAHVSDVKEFIEAAKNTLKPTGVLVLEFPYLINFIENNEFDTVYFEHLSYFSISPLFILCKECGLTVMNVEKQEIHGGSVRVTIGFGSEDETVQKFINDEIKYKTIEPYLKFAEAAKKSILNFSEKLNELKQDGRSIAGFAASAKGNTLLNCAGITVGSLKYIVDETPEKIGKYSPGTFIPIVSMIDLKRTPPDYLVILSWNFEKSIIKKCKEAGYRGKFIIPIPKWKIL